LSTPIVAPSLAEGGRDPSAAFVDARQASFKGEMLETRIYDRSRLLQGNVIEGPAIVTQLDSTTLILPGYRGEIDRVGNIIINPAE
jgi:N-methylhydantoinase A